MRQLKTDSRLPLVYTTWLLFLPLAPMITTFLSLLSSLTLLPNATEEIIISVLLLTALYAVLSSPRARQTLSRLNRTTFAKILILYFAFAAFHLILGRFKLGELVGFIINVRFIPALLLGAAIGSLYPGCGESLKRSLVLAGLIAVIAAVIIFILPNHLLVSLGYDAPGVDTFGRPASQYFISNSLLVERLQGTLRSPNSLGVYLLIPLGVLLFDRGKIFAKKKIRTIAFCVIGIGILLTFSRSAWVGTLVILSFYALAALKHPTKTKSFRPLVLILSLSFISLSLLAWLTIASSSWQAIIYHQDVGDNKGSTSVRINVYADSVRAISKNAFGYGQGSVGNTSRIGGGATSPVNQSPENSYLQTGLELGFVGLLLFGAVLFFALRQMLIVTPEWDKKMLVATSSSLMVVGLFFPVWSDKALVFTWWLVIGFFVARNYQGASKTKDG